MTGLPASAYDRRIGLSLGRFLSSIISPPTLRSRTIQEWHAREDRSDGALDRRSSLLRRHCARSRGIAGAPAQNGAGI